MDQIRPRVGLTHTPTGLVGSDGKKLHISQVGLSYSRVEFGWVEIWVGWVELFASWVGTRYGWVGWIGHSVADMRSRLSADKVEVIELIR